MITVSALETTEAVAVLPHPTHPATFSIVLPTAHLRDFYFMERMGYPAPRL
jgi:hypothetical protein